MLREDGHFGGEMQLLLTAAHYDAIMYKASKKQETPSLKKKIKGFIFPAKKQ